MRVPVIYNSLQQDASPEVVQGASGMAIRLPNRLSTTPLPDTEAKRLGFADPAPVATQPGRLIDMLQVNMPDQRRMGGRVTVIGRVLKPNKQRLAQANAVLADAGSFPQVNAALFRFAMTCCAGDAQAVTVFLHLPNPDAMEQGAWVELTGDLAQTANNLPVLLEADELRFIDEPARPYLTISPFR
jgi:hypothetical protein